MTLCIFEACRYSRLAEGQERMEVGREVGRGACGHDKKGSGGEKKSKVSGIRRREWGREIRKSGRTDKQA